PIDALVASDPERRLPNAGAKLLGSTGVLDRVGRCGGEHRTGRRAERHDNPDLAPWRHEAPSEALMQRESPVAIQRPFGSIRGSAEPSGLVIASPKRRGHSCPMISRRFSSPPRWHRKGQGLRFRTLATKGSG